MRNDVLFLQFVWRKHRPHGEWKCNAFRVCVSGTVMVSQNFLQAKLAEEKTLSSREGSESGAVGCWKCRRWVFQLCPGECLAADRRASPHA